MISVLFDRESAGNYKAQLALRGIRGAIAKRKYENVFYDETADVPKAKAFGCPIIVFTHSERRSVDISNALCDKGYRPVFVVNRASCLEHTASGVSIDYRKACYRLTRHILSAGNTSVAFLGFNHDSIPDKQRLDGFEAAMGEVGAEGRVFANFGDVNTCLDAYWSERKRLRNVVCVNDIHAVALLNRLKESGEDVTSYRICGFGNTMLSRFSTPRITTVEPNYELAGRCAVEVFQVLERNPSVRAVTFTVDAEICEGETLLGRVAEVTDPVSAVLPEENDFYADETVKELDGLDAMLSLCDETDLAILRHLLAGQTYERICERLFISENTLKYRIKKLVSSARADSKTSLLNIIRRYRLNL